VYSSWERRQLRGKGLVGVGMRSLQTGRLQHFVRVRGPVRPQRPQYVSFVSPPTPRNSDGVVYLDLGECPSGIFYTGVCVCPTPGLVRRNWGSTIFWWSLEQ
jgi:hypothetical protein